MPDELLKKNQEVFKIKPIGYVKNEFFESAESEKMRQKNSYIVIYPEFQEGLYGIEESNFLNVIFYFHKSVGYTLKGARRRGVIRGIFASRSPRRPVSLGLTLVKLLEKKGNKLKVKGLDAINGTPVLDIKPYVGKMDNPTFPTNNP